MSFDSSEANVKTHKALLLERVTERKNMGTISMPQGKGNRAHNVRNYGEDKMPPNIDITRTKENIVLHDETLHSAYHRIFDKELEEYNHKQKRADRKIKDYYQHIKNSQNGEKLFYEDILQWGKKEDFELHPELREVAKMCLKEFIEGSKENGNSSFNERNPGLELIGAYIHMDEASPHMHFDYIPVASGYKTGMFKRNSLDRAMKTLIKERTGHEYSPRKSEVDAKGKCIDNATKQWKEMERAYFKSICIKYGLVVDAEVATPERDSLSVLEYKKITRENEVKALTETVYMLKGKILTTEDVYKIDIHKPILSQSTKVPYIELASLIATAERVNQAEKEVVDTNEKAEKIVKQANEMKMEAEAIISQKESIIKEAKEKAQLIIQEAIETATLKAKETLNKIKEKICELKNTQKNLEDEIADKTRLGDQILKNKKSEAREEADRIINDAIRKTGAEDVAREISKRLGMVSLKEVADAKKKVIDAYKEYEKYDKNGIIAKAIDENDMEEIEKCFRSSFSYSGDNTIERKELWNEAILQIKICMENYLRVKAEPHTVDEVMEDIKATMAYRTEARHNRIR